MKVKPMNAAQTMIVTVMKNMGIDPDRLKDQAEALFKRFVALEKQVENVSEDRLIQLEARIQAIEEHWSMNEETAVHSDAGMIAGTISNGGTMTNNGTVSMDDQKDHTTEHTGA